MKLLYVFTATNGKILLNIFWGEGNSLTRQAGLLAASQYVGAVIGFLTNIFAARTLGAVEFGTAALILSYPTLLWSFLSFKPTTVTIRYISSFRANRQRMELASICKVGYTLDLFTSIAVLIFISVTSWWVATYIYKLPEVLWLIIVYGASFPFFSLIGTSQAVLTSWQYFHWLSLFQVLEKIVTLFFMVGFLTFGFGAAGMVIAIGIGHSISGIITAVAATYLLSRDGYGLWWRASFADVALLRKELTSFFGWNYLFVTLGGVIGQVPVILLGRIRGPEEAGFYRLATSITTAASYIEGSFGRVVYPNLSARWAEEERDSVKSSLKQWTLRYGLPVGVFFIVVIPFLPILIPMFFGSGYYPMVSGTQIMLVGAAASAIFFWLNPFYYASGKIGLWTKTYGIYAVFAIGVGWLSIHHWGFSGMTTVVTVGKVLLTLWLVVPVMVSGRFLNESLHLPSFK